MSEDFDAFGREENLIKQNYLHKVDGTYTCQECGHVTNAQVNILQKSRSFAMDRNSNFHFLPKKFLAFLNSKFHIFGQFVIKMLNSG